MTDSVSVCLLAFYDCVHSFMSIDKIIKTPIETYYKKKDVYWLIYLTSFRMDKNEESRQTYPFIKWSNWK